MQKYFDYFQNEYPHIYVEKDFDFKRHTTIGIGGLSPLAVFPQNCDELKSILQYCFKHSMPYYPLGKGSNLLVADNGFNGFVIVTSRMQSVCLKENYLYAEAGLSLTKLVQFAKAHSFDGYVPLLGFPATVGGAIYMNAGIQTGHMGDIVHEVYAMDRAGNVQVFQKEDCKFAYKNTVFMQNKAVIFAALLQTKKIDLAVIEKAIVARKQERATLPKERSMGCVFENFEDVPAGQLIDLAGCKGLQIGGAKVSTEHANFIVNMGSATAQDVRQLIAILKERVYNKFKRQLKEEIEYLGDF